MSDYEQEAAMAAQVEGEAAMAAQADADRQAYEEACLRELAERDTYIGDGVYARFDGYQVWIKAQRDGFTHQIALERAVMRELINYSMNFYGRLP